MPFIVFEVRISIRVAQWLGLAAIVQRRPVSGKVVLLSVDDKIDEG